MLNDIEVERAKYVRRLFAVLADALIVAAILAVAGVLLMNLTNGGIRVGNTLINSTECTPAADRIPEGVSVPTQFTPTHIVRCTRYFAGVLAHDWFFAFIRHTQVSPGVTQTLTVTVPLDPNGRVAKPFYLDNLFWIFLLGYWLIWEREDGETAGKRMFGLKVRSLDGSNPTLTQTAKRLLRTAPLIFWPLSFLIGGANPNTLIFTTIVVVGWAVLILANFIWTTRCAKLPWHDQWAGTEVVRVKSRPIQDVVPLQKDAGA